MSDAPTEVNFVFMKVIGYFQKKVSIWNTQMDSYNKVPWGIFTPLSFQRAAICPKR